jgi:hypothetical protein
MRRIASLVCLLAGTVGCVTTPPDGPDEICSQIAQFANSSADQAVHTVELTTDWGGVFSKEKDLLYEKNCAHNAYEPGKRLCSYLMANTSIEFPDNNIRRALSCLPDAHSGWRAGRKVEYTTGRVTSHRAKYVKAGIVVAVEYSGGTDKAPTLKISAQRVKGS